MPRPLVSAMRFLTRLTCSFGEGRFGLGLPICRIGGGDWRVRKLFVFCMDQRRIHPFLVERGSL
jgi:hypothetical protein